MIRRTPPCLFFDLKVGIKRGTRGALFWLIDNVRLGPLAPWVLGMALGRMPKKKDQR